jgi:predicted nucleotide-binding protein
MINPELLAKIEKKLGVGKAQVYKIIAKEANRLKRPRQVAALNLASDNGINISKYATAEDYTTLGTLAGAPPQAVAMANPPTQVVRTKQTAANKSAKTKKTGRRIFVIHGRNEKARAGLFDLLRRMGLEPMEFQSIANRVRTGSPTMEAILEKAFKDADAVIALFTPDDEATLRKSFRKASQPGDSRKRQQPRPNVLLEAGMALGYMPKRTVFVHVGTIGAISDLAGKHYIPLDATTASKNNLASRLKAIGMPVDTSGTDWLEDDGSFTPTKWKKR